MYEFSPHKLPRATHYYDRVDPFAEWSSYEENDLTSALVPLVLRLGENLERIFGAETVEPAMQALTTNGRIHKPTWRDTAQEGSIYMEWRLGEQFRWLLGYTMFGLGWRRDADASRPGSEAFLEAILHTVEGLLDDCPVTLWLPEVEADKLTSFAWMARGRWNFDHRRNVSPEALALLGGVKMTRIRNMLSGAAPELPRGDDGLVLYGSAAAWLAKREEFLPTAWDDEDAPEEAAAGERDQISSPLFVPVARDGSVFHPGLARNGGYQIGSKDNEQRIGTFEEALDLLQRMDVPRWRRPNPNGNWGIVAATEWRRMGRGDLDALAEKVAT